MQFAEALHPFFPEKALDLKEIALHKAPKKETFNNLVKILALFDPDKILKNLEYSKCFTISEMIEIAEILFSSRPDGARKILNLALNAIKLEKNNASKCRNLEKIAGVLEKMERTQAKTSIKIIKETYNIVSGLKKNQSRLESRIYSAITSLASALAPFNLEEALEMASTIPDSYDAKAKIALRLFKTPYKIDQPLIVMTR